MRLNKVDGKSDKMINGIKEKNKRKKTTYM